MDVCGGQAALIVVVLSVLKSDIQGWDSQKILRQIFKILVTLSLKMSWLLAYETFFETDIIEG